MHRRQRFLPRNFNGPTMFWAAAAVMGLLAACCRLEAVAQSPPASSKPARPYATRPAAERNDATSPSAPDRRPAQARTGSPTSANQNQERTAAVILVKNALIAVNQGNLTGNFTVLRDLSSPGFRTRNSAGDLAAIFQNIRQQKIDLSPIVVLDPILNQPRVNERGELLLEGYFDSQPLRINFQLAFIKAETGGWMIDVVSVGVVPAEVAPAERAVQRPAQQR